MSVFHSLAQLWEEGRAVAVHYGLKVRQGTYTFYESASARVIETSQRRRSLGFPPMFQGVRTFVLEPVANARTNFRMTEVLAD